MQTSDQTTSSSNPGVLASSRDQTADPAASPHPPSTATAPDPEATRLPTLNPTSVDPRTSNLITGRRRIGKVARLPKPARDKLNHMLEDGASYPDIIAALGPDGADLNEKNISPRSAGFEPADRGRDGVVSATPPSEPDGRISRIRLSSQWCLNETNYKCKSRVPD